jgi:hypothetical protein
MRFAYPISAGRLARWPDSLAPRKSEKKNLANNIYWIEHSKEVRNGRARLCHEGEPLIKIILFKGPDGIFGTEVEVAPRGNGTTFGQFQSARNASATTTLNPRFVGAASFTLCISDQAKLGTTCMLHHAARVSKRTLLTRTSSPEPANIRPGSAFTTALQVAAARAWTRTAVRNPRNVSTSVSVTLEEGNTSRTRKPIQGVPSNSDPRSWLDGRQNSSFACVGHCVVFGGVLTRI